jgi:hypothetical protein
LFSSLGRRLQLECEKITPPPQASTRKPSLLRRAWRVLKNA